MFLDRSFFADQIEIAYAVGPASGPPLVFLHGIAGSWEEYQPFFRHFAPGWHTYACNLRGHGLSGRAADGAYRVADYVPDIVAFLREEVREPAVLVGHSLGAMTAVGTAVILPSRVRALVLLDPPLPEGELRMDGLHEIRQYLSWMRDQAATARSVDEVAAAYVELVPGTDQDRARREAWSIYCVAPEVLDVALDDRLLDGFDLRRALAQVECPVLLLRGDVSLGAVLRDEDVGFVRSAVPGATVSDIPGAGHMLHEDQPTLVLRHIGEFLRAVPGRFAGQPPRVAMPDSETAESG